MYVPKSAVGPTVGGVWLETLCVARRPMAKKLDPRRYVSRYETDGCLYIGSQDAKRTVTRDGTKTHDLPGSM